jgi:hypothetical protein
MAAVSSAAESFYRQIAEAGNPAAFLNDLVSTHTQEEEWLEFKGAQDPTSGNQIPDATVAKYWSKAISGFANTGGGVLIWGIDARLDTTTGIDGAGALSLVPDPPAFKLRLNHLLQHATDPPVMGIALNEYSHPGQAPAGFVVCLVPESSFKPHRAERVEGKPYFIRINDRFEIAPHPLLRHMFYPQHHARFRLEVGVNWVEDNHRIVVRVDARLANVGQKSAHDVLVQVRTNPTFGIHPYHPFYNVEPNVSGWHPFASHRPLHPSFPERLFTAAHEEAGLMCWDQDGPHPKPGLQRLTVQVQVYAADEEPQGCTVEFGDRDIDLKRTKVAMSTVGLNLILQDP